MRLYNILIVLILTFWAIPTLLGSQSSIQKTAEIHVSAICGKGIHAQNNKCEVVLLKEHEFSMWKKEELKIEDLKTRGLTPLKLTDLTEGVYYVGVSAEIDLALYNPNYGKPNLNWNSLPDMRQWCIDFFLNDRFVRGDFYISVVRKTQVGTFFRKWYPVKATHGKPALVVSIYLPRELPLKDHFSFYPNKNTFKINTTLELISDMGSKLSEFWDINEQDWSTMIQLVSRGGKAAANFERGDCVVNLDLEGNLLVSFPDFKLPKGKIEDSVPLTPAKIADPNVSIDELLPTFESELKGSNEVRIVNPNDFVVTAGLRSNGRGKNMHIPANGRYSVFVPDGKYDIYFVYSSEPGALFQGDSFKLTQNGVEIQIVKVVGGNYSIKRVKTR